MIRRFSCRLAGALCVFATTAMGCGGTTDTELFPPTGHASTVTGFGAKSADRVYFNVTNGVSVGGVPTLAAFRLEAGAKVELEIATRDSSPLVFELHRVRRDGTTELLSPVHATSGFHLAELEASSAGTYVAFFPATDRRDVFVVVHLECKDAASRCAPLRQPGESCDAVFTCDEGLACSTANRTYLAEGICFVPTEAPSIP